jgi:hypothetical protein
MLIRVIAVARIPDRNSSSVKVGISISGSSMRLSLIAIRVDIPVSRSSIPSGQIGLISFSLWC